MISHDQLAKALARQGVNLDDRKVNALLNDLLPNPQSGFSCDGATVWGDSHSIDKVKLWNHNASNVPYYATQLRQEREQHTSLVNDWRRQVDSNQQRAIRAEELGLRLLDFVLKVSADNPAAIGQVRAAHELLDSLNIEPREGFYIKQEDSLADARTKFYDAAHPTTHPRD